MKIEKEITIEELVSVKPDSIVFLMEKGIKCIACGEPVWGTFEEAAKLKNFNDAEIEALVEELNNL